MKHHTILIGVRPTQPENKFAEYLGEMLSFEGITDFEFVDIDKEFNRLTNHMGLVILSRCKLKFKEIEEITAYIKRGGRVIIIQPSNHMARAIGIETRKRVSIKPYLLPDSSHAASRTLMPEAIQCHVPIEHFDCTNAEIIAHAYKDRETPADCPAIVSYCLGKGRVGLFFYDIPKAVARIRFGDPELVGLQTLGLWKDTHSADLFTEHVDLKSSHIPQADIHCILLGNMARHISSLPVASWWYYPKSEQKSAIVIRSDDDWSTPEQFEMLRKAVEKRNGHITFFLVRNTKVTAGQVEKYQSRGHSFGIHPNVYGIEEDPYFTAAKVFSEDVEHIKKLYSNQIKSSAHHAGNWPGYMDLVSTYIKNGVRMMVDYTSLLENFHKYMCGSARPMRFVDINGKIYNCYQQPTVTYDDSSIEHVLKNNPEIELEKVRNNVRDSIKYHYSPLSICSHPVSFATYSSKFIEGLFDMAVENNMPILSTDEWADFTDLRNDTKLNLISSDHNGYQFQIEAKAENQGVLTVIIPLAKGAAKPKAVFFDNQNIPYELSEISRFVYIAITIEVKNRLHRLKVDLEV